jgi:hypothetical protein
MLDGSVALKVTLEGAEEAQSQLDRLANQLKGFTSLSQTIAQAGVAMTTFGYTLYRVAQVPFASEIESARLQLLALTGSAEASDQALARFLDIALRTRFDTSEVVQFASLLMGVGISAEQAAQEMSQLLDLMAGLGVRRSDFDRVIFNLLQLRSGAGTAADIRQLLSAMPAIGTVLGRATGAGRPLTITEISQLYQRLGGEAFFEELLRAAQQFRGAAERLTIADILANFAETLSVAMIPTAEALAAILRVLVRILTPVVNLFAKLNQLLYGIPGLLIALSAALVAAANAARFFASVTGLASITGLGSSLRGVFGWLLKLPALGAGLLGMLRGVLGGLGSVLPVLGRFALRFTLLATVFIGVMELLARLFGGRGALAGQLRQLGVFGGVGATLGALLGSIFPVIGTLIGGLIGLAAGAIVYALKTLFFGERGRDDPMRQTARNTARIAQSMEAIKIHLIGGGERARMAATRYEVEAYLRRLAVSGI